MESTVSARRILNKITQSAKSTQSQIDNLLNYMDIYLFNLGDAISKGDKIAIENNKYRLDTVRKLLLELEYFPSVDK